jgi:hypothetical protein
MSASPRKRPKCCSGASAAMCQHQTSRLGFEMTGEVVNRGNRCVYTRIICEAIFASVECIRALLSSFPTRFQAARILQLLHKAAPKQRGFFDKTTTEAIQKRSPGALTGASLLCPRLRHIPERPQHTQRRLADPKSQSYELEPLVNPISTTEMAPAIQPTPCPVRVISDDLAMSASRPVYPR